jgi:hypothetical protein
VPPTFTAIDAAGLGLDRAALLAAMEPFVACRLTPTDPRWTAEVARKSDKARRRLRRRRWLGWIGRGKRRDQARIETEYDHAWARKRLAPYEMDPRPRDGSAWRYGDEVMFATSAAALPFADRAFDLVYSSLALEQMEEIRDRALGESSSGTATTGASAATTSSRATTSAAASTSCRATGSSRSS